MYNSPGPICLLWDISTGRGACNIFPPGKTRIIYVVTVGFQRVLNRIQQVIHGGVSINHQILTRFYRGYHKMTCVGILTPLGDPTFSYQFTKYRGQILPNKTNRFVSPQIKTSSQISFKSTKRQQNLTSKHASWSFDLGL